MINPEVFKYQQAILDQALAQGIKKNEEQEKIWRNYKKRHQKVIEALKILPLDVSTNCMVPIGKRAFMEGKLTHTNEILVYLGDNYFAKYSAHKAIELCNRRIKNVDEQLQNLEKERNLYETRQMIPFGFDAFGNEERKDLTEHWDDEKLDDWRAKHREREKAYHQKLAKLRCQEKPEIRTEEDVLNRLDQLELEEELKDEYDRIEDEQNKFYGEELEEGEVYYESDEEDSISEDEMNEAIQEELEKLKELQLQKENMEKSKEISSNLREPSVNVTENVNKNVTTEKQELFEANFNNSLHENILQTKEISEVENQSSTKIEEKPKIVRRVSFVEKTVEKNNSKSPKRVSDELTDSEDEDTIKIEFEHSDNNPIVEEAPGDSIETPKDFYKVFLKPKSILKRFSQDMLYVKDTITTSYSSEEESEGEHVSVSAYRTVVKDIQERVVATSVKEEQTTEASASRPVSRFKMQRSKK
ncbi:unconventional prefoldin RPB5 interactor-like protein [Prorops nasuta]|uniref:unconventional prefoldin RPB5 interactor-like protein n=1 Tax=Prorops nasuta TaxID=863751 RepID=UPI0034CE7770